MSTQTWMRGLVGLLGMLLFAGAVGCGGIDGEQGNVELVYRSDGLDVSSKEPIAVGASVELRTASKTTGEREPMKLTNVTSSDPSTIAVENVGEANDNTFELAAKSEGEARIDIEGKDSNNKSVTDYVTFRAAEATRVELGHTCPEEEKPVYLADQNVSVQREFKNEQEDLVGWGYDPIEISPESSDAGMTGEVRDSRYAGVYTGTMSGGTIELQPTIGGDTMGLEIRSADAIDSVEWIGGEPDKPFTGTFEQGGEQLIPTFHIGDKMVCESIIDVDVDNKTPDTCEVEAETVSAAKTFGDQLLPTRTTIRVKGKKEDTCHFEMTVNGTVADVSKSAMLELKEE